MADGKDKDGVWRTICGRRIFIRKGQSLTDAMRESGKFKKSDIDSAKSESAKSAPKSDTPTKYGGEKSKKIFLAGGLLPVVWVGSRFSYPYRLLRNFEGR